MVFFSNLGSRVNPIPHPESVGTTLKTSSADGPMPQPEFHPAPWTSSRRLDFIPHAGLHPAAWVSSRSLDFIPQAGLYPAGWTSSRRLDFIPQAGRSSRSLEGSVNPLCDRYTLDPLPLNTPVNKGDPEHLTLRAAGFAGGRPCP